MKIQNYSLFKKKLSIIFAFICLVSFVCAENSNNTIAIEAKAGSCMNESKQILMDMQENVFSIIRINDSLKQLINLYSAQNILKEEKKKYDFSLVIPYCEDIRKIENSARDSRDKINALKQFYNQSVSGLNTTSIDIIVSEADQEMENERYEKVPNLVDKAYTEIINVKSQQTTLNLFYEATTTGFKKFLYKNRYPIISLIIILLAVFIIYHKAIRKWLIKRKISKLELRKKNLKEMITEVQKAYFERGEISEGIFNIKTKKFAELIRDVDQQIPLLREEIEKINFNKKDEPSRI